MMSGITRKNSAALSFPVVLNIESIVTGGELEINPGLRISEGLGRRILYQLKSVIAHYGNHHNGHYICYRRTAKGMWFKISDDKVW